MGISVFWARSQANSISSSASELETIKSKLQTFKESLNNGWKAEEMTHINSAIDKIISDLSSLSTKLEGISTDIISAAEQIRREEEAAKAAAEARAKAEAEKAKAKN